MAELTTGINKMNILLVEDDPAVRKVTTRLLEFLQDFLQSFVAMRSGANMVNHPG